MLKVILQFNCKTKVIWLLFVVVWRERDVEQRYIKVNVEHYLLFMFSPPKINQTIPGLKYICLHLFTVFYLIQPSSKQIICFDFRKQNSVLPIVFYVPCVERLSVSRVECQHSLPLSQGEGERVLVTTRRKNRDQRESEREV